MTRAFMQASSGRGWVVLVSLAVIVTACAPASPAAAPNQPQAAAPEQAKPKAAASQPAAAKPAAPTGTVTIGLSDYGPEERWLPWLAGVGDHQVMGAVYDYLFGRTAGPDKLEPRLAERYEWSPDNKALTLHLRRGVQFHDGRGEMTAEDVEFSLQKYAETARAPGAPYFKQTIEGIKVVDPYTLELKLAKPDWSLPYSLSNATARVAIVSKQYVESVGEEQAADHPIGTGPFKFVEAKRNSFVKLEAVENHWRQTPAMKTLVLRMIPEDGTRLAALRAGEVDVIDVLYDNVAELSSLGFKMLPIKYARAVFLTLGGQNAPDHKFYDGNVPWVGPDAERARLVRQALSLAVDRNTIVEKIYAGQAEVVAVPGFNPGAPWTDPAMKPYAYDPAKAKELLAKAGYPDGFPIKLMSVTGQGPEFPQVAEAVGAYWTRNLGLQVELVPIEWGTLRPKMVARDTLGISWVHGMQSNMNPEPGVTYSNQWTCEGNYIVVACDEQLDKGFSSLLTEVDEQKRVDIRKGIAKRVYDQYYVVPIAMGNLVFAANAKKITEWPLVPGSVYAANYEYMKLAK